MFEPLNCSANRIGWNDSQGGIAHQRAVTMIDSFNGRMEECSSYYEIMSKSYNDLAKATEIEEPEQHADIDEISLKVGYYSEQLL